MVDLHNLLVGPSLHICGKKRKKNQKEKLERVKFVGVRTKAKDGGNAEVNLKSDMVLCMCWDQKKKMGHSEMGVGAD